VNLTETSHAHTGCPFCRAVNIVTEQLCQLRNHQLGSSHTPVCSMYTNSLTHNKTILSKPKNTVKLW